VRINKQTVKDLLNSVHIEGIPNWTTQQLYDAYQQLEIALKVESEPDHIINTVVQSMGRKYPDLKVSCFSHETDVYCVRVLNVTRSLVVEIEDYIDEIEAVLMREGIDIMLLPMLKSPEVTRKYYEE
jgi:hypothetical protein